MRPIIYKELAFVYIVKGERFFDKEKAIKYAKKLEKEEERNA